MATNLHLTPVLRICRPLPLLLPVPSWKFMCRLLPLHLHKSIIDLFCLGVKTWFPMSAEQHRLNVFRNKMLQGIIGHKVLGGDNRKIEKIVWREIHNLPPSQNFRAIKSRGVRYAGYFLPKAGMRSGLKMLRCREQTTWKTWVWMGEL